MSEHGAVLQSNIMELVKYIENFKTQRIQLMEVVKRDELEKSRISGEITILNQQLDKVNRKISDMSKLRDDLNVTIQQTESHLKQLLDSSHVMLSVIKQEENTLKM